MNHASQLFLSLILVSLLFCTFSWANDVCSDGAGYPDQYPFKNCGSVSTLTWDQANSCEELADNSSCTVAVAGGQGPYTWTISGTGFSFASGQTSIQTSENTVTVFTQDACGTGSITVIDGCLFHPVTLRIASTDGKWSDNISGIGQKGLIGEYTGQHAGANYIYRGETKTIRQFERRLSSQGCGSSAYCSTVCYSYCGNSDSCNLNCSTFGCCTHFESIFINIEYYNSTPQCVDFLGRNGLLGGGAGYDTSCSCSCTISNWYQKWICN